jgi:dTDP-4-amino-4,6-dideoxygalactose transaminase
MKRKIKINDFKVFSKLNKKKLIMSFSKVLRSGNYVLSNEVKNFEKRFSNYLKINFCVSLANGTDAIEIALRACGIKKNDPVATAANAGMYTTTAVLSIGAKPLFIDVDLNTNSICYNQACHAISKGAKAIVVTHLYGLANPDIKKIAQICKKKKIFLIEDCAQAHGAKIGNNFVGSFGDAATFSFYPTKNLGALGDGGAIVTNKNRIAKIALKLRQYGWSSKYKTSIAGGRNSRLDEIQASFLSNLLLNLDKLNKKRRVIANFYSKMIKNKNIITPKQQGTNFVAHQYVIRTNKRNSLIKWLNKSNINSVVHYPIPDHKQNILKKYYSKEILTNTEKLSREVLSIPCHPYLKHNEIKKILKVLNSWRA